MAETRKKTSFPQNKEQAERFALQTSKIIHEDEQIKKILQEQSQGGQAPMSTVIGGVAAQILTLLFTKLREQTQGMKVGSKYVIEIIRLAVKEIAAIADSMGLDTSVEDEQMAAKVAGDALDASMRGGGQGQPQGQVPPQQPQPQQQGMMAQATQVPAQQGGIV